MEQFLVNLYAFTNICLLMWYIKRYGWQFSPGLLVLGFYVMIALLAVPAYGMLKHDEFFSQYNFTNITLCPYIYLFITTLLLLYPTFKFKGYLRNIHISISEKKLRLFIIIYTICSIISVYCFYRTITSNITIETLAQVRQDHYEGETLKPYDNELEHVIILFTVQFNVIASIVFFYTLANRTKGLNSLWLIGLGIGIITPYFMNAIMTASRGMIINLAFQLILCYSYFSNLYSKKIKNIFIVTGIVGVIIFLIYSLIVTEMRFGGGEDSFSSIISYFGQPTIVFNSQVAEIVDYAYGVRFFFPLVELFGVNPEKIILPIVKSWNPCFDTIIGDLYVDFGAMGTFLISIFVPYFINSFFARKKSLTLSHIYLMTFYCLSLQHGALVTGYGFCTNILFCIVIYNICNMMLGRSIRCKKTNLITCSN